MGIYHIYACVCNFICVVNLHASCTSVLQLLGVCSDVRDLCVMCDIVDCRHAEVQTSVSINTSDLPMYRQMIHGSIIENCVQTVL